MSICEPGRNASTPMLTVRPPLTTALTLPLMRPLVLEDLDDLVPVLVVGGLLLGEDDHALVVFEALEEHFDFVADLEVFDVIEFAQGDDALGFVADVHEDFARADFEDASFDDAALFELAGLIFASNSCISDMLMDVTNPRLPISSARACHMARLLQGKGSGI